MKPFDYFTADLHLGDSRMDLLGRPHADVDAAAQDMVRNYNALVQPDDHVLFVGDVAVNAAWLKRLEEMHGTKVLIRGNHDRWASTHRLRRYFSQVIEEGDGLDLETQGVACHATHYPTRGKDSRLNLVGHIHGAWKVQKNMLNVGVDVHHFCPVPAHRIPFYLEAIGSFYDQDVWCADHLANAAHAARGKPGQYFPDEVKAKTQGLEDAWEALLCGDA